MTTETKRDGTDDALDAAFDRGRERRDKGGKELHGDFDGYVLAVGGVAKGEFEMDLSNDKVIFHWEDTGSAWPSSFVLTSPGTLTVPSTSHSETFEHKSFSGSGTSFDVSHCQYELRYGSTLHGWMHYHANGTTWYAVPSKLTAGGLIDAPALEFAANTTSGSVTAVKLYDSAI